MILGIGIDSVENKRFNDYHLKPRTTLQRIYSEEEINYCLENNSLSTERFAIRFAAREALFKALHQALPTIEIPLFTLCQATTISKVYNGAPTLQICWELLTKTLPIPSKIIQATYRLSLTHTKDISTAFVIIHR